MHWPDLCDSKSTIQSWCHEGRSLIVPNHLGKPPSLDSFHEEDDEEGEGEEEEEEEKPSAKRGRTVKGKAKTAPTAKAASKRKATKGKTAKKGKDTDGDVDMDDAEDEAGDEDEEEEEVAKKPASKKPASKKPASKAADKGKGKDLPQKMVTVVKRGKAPQVEGRSGWAMSHEVLITDDGVWDVTLNQTDVGNNANKFYILQLLHPVGNNSASNFLSPAFSEAF